MLAESGQPALEAVGPNRALRGRSSFLLWPRFLPFSTSSHPSSIQSAPPRVVGCLLGIDILAKCSSRWIPKGTSRSQAYSISLRFFKIITPLEVISIQYLEMELLATWLSQMPQWEVRILCSLEPGLSNIGKVPTFSPVFIISWSLGSSMTCCSRIVGSEL